MSETPAELTEQDAAAETKKAERFKELWAGDWSERFDAIELILGREVHDSEYEIGEPLQRIFRWTDNSDIAMQELLEYMQDEAKREQERLDWAKD